MPTTNDVAEQIRPRVIGARVVGMVAATGPMPGITLVLENEHEQRAELSFQTGIQATLQGHCLTAQGLINVTVTEFKA